MSDLIDRQAALVIIQSLYPGMPRVPWLRKDWQERYEPYINAEKAIRTLPSAQSEPRWIPVTDRLPKLGEKVLVSTKNTVFAQVFKRIYGTPDNWGWEHNTIKKVTAWMPLPAPYAERKKDE